MNVSPPFKYLFTTEDTIHQDDDATRLDTFDTAGQMLSSDVSVRSSPWSTIKSTTKQLKGAELNFMSWLDAPTPQEISTTNDVFAASTGLLSDAGGELVPDYTISAYTTEPPALLIPTAEEPYMCVFDTGCIPLSTDRAGVGIDNDKQRASNQHSPINYGPCHMLTLLSPPPLTAWKKVSPGKGKSLPRKAKHVRTIRPSKSFLTSRHIQVNIFKQPK